MARAKSSPSSSPSSAIYHLAPHEMAGFVLASGPAVAGYSNQSCKLDPAQWDCALIESNLGDCMVSLLGQLAA